MASQSSTPTLSVRLAIEPQVMVLDGPQRDTYIQDGLPRYPPLNWEQQPTISLTVTSSDTRPITIFTWPTIFHLGLSQSRHNFRCWDLTSDSPIRLQDTRGPQRPPFSYTKGDVDDEYFHTLEPGVPITFTSRLGVAYSAAAGLQRGHRYRFSVSEGESIGWWRYGTRDEVMAPPGQVTNLLEDDETAIPIHVEPVEFEVK